MAYNIFTNLTTADSDEVDENSASMFNLVLLNGIRLIKDASSANFNVEQYIQDLYGEAYSDADGTNDTVNTTDTTAVFDTDSYVPGWATTGAEESTSFSTANNNPVFVETDIAIAADGIFTTVRFVTNGGDATVTIKKNTVSIATDTSAQGAGSHTVTFVKADYSDFLETGDTGAVRVEVSGGSTVATKLSQSYNGTLFDISGKTVLCDNAGDEYGYTAVDDIVEGTVVHDIPTGSFPATIDKSHAVCLIKNWEAGDSMQYKLINGGEDSGWLEFGTMSSFTAFTSEPTEFHVKLTPKTSPTTGYPSIYGSAVYADN